MKLCIISLYSELICRLQEKRCWDVASRLRTLIFTFHCIYGILPFTWPTSAGHFLLYALMFFFWFLPLPPNRIFSFYFKSKCRRFQEYFSIDFLRKMKNATWDNFRYFLDIYFGGNMFLLIVECNFGHKAPVMNFMFLKHCRIILL